MEKWICLILLICLLQPVAGYELFESSKKESKDPWFAIDKLKHLSSSFIITTTGYYMQNRMMDKSKNQSMNGAALITISLGLGKETSDKHKPNGFFSFRDLAADGMGIGLAFLFIKGIE